VSSSWASSVIPAGRLRPVAGTRIHRSVHRCHRASRRPLRNHAGRKGSLTLAFDHRNFEASGGQPRQHEDAAGKLTDLLAANSLLAAHDAVDANRLGCIGICLGGGYVLRHSAFDPRIKALALVAAAFNDPHTMRRNLGAAAFRADGTVRRGCPTPVRHR
jgi:hypothetical protein